VEKIERIHQRKHLTIHHNKEQKAGELRTNEIFAITIFNVLCTKYYE
jgi:hypothetical protein